jgi:hypothetical protein
MTVSGLFEWTKRVLGLSATSQAVKTAARPDAADSETEQARLAALQRRCLGELGERADLSVLASKQAWR